MSRGFDFLKAITVVRRISSSSNSNNNNNTLSTNNDGAGLAGDDVHIIDSVVASPRSPTPHHHHFETTMSTSAPISGDNTNRHHDQTQAPIEPEKPSLFKGLMSVSSAMKKFRQKLDKPGEEAVVVTTPITTVEEQGDKKSEPSTPSGQASDDEEAAAAEEKDIGLFAVYNYVAESVKTQSPQRTALVMAAKRGDWTAAENELKKCHRHDRRLNMAVPETGETTLMLACQHSRFLLVARLGEMGALMNVRSDDRRTALHYAAAVGHEEIVKVLLKRRADPNLFGGAHSQLPLHIIAARAVGSLSSAQCLLRASLKESRLLKDGLGNLPISYAVESGSIILVKEMLQYYPKEQVTWCQDHTGDYLVHIAARKKNTDIMNVLGLDGQADVNVQNHDGQTPLHVSARLGDDAMVKLLQTFKANADVIDKKERTPLHVAAENGHTLIVELLVERYRANVHMRTKDGSTLMHLAADHGYADTVLAFIKRGVPLNMPNKSGTLCLHAAAQNGHVQVVKTLIQKGSPVDGRTKDGYTALHLAVLSSKPEIIQTLLGFGAKVDLKGGQAREAPLHIAARMPEGYHCAEMLLKSGAIVNNCTEETLETPLHITARNGFLDLLKLLLEEGADPMRLNKAGESALHIAVRHCHYESAKAIINFVNNNSSGRDATNLVNLANNEGETCFHLGAELGKSQTHNPFEDIDIIRLLLENGADPLSVTKLTNETSLHYCARSGNPDIFQEIVRHLQIGFQLACNRQDKMGWSPLMTASEQGHAAVSEIMLANSARADVFDEYGKAALHLAAENGHIACCEILLNYKAFVNAKSKLGITPLHFAAQNGYAELVKFLIEKYHAATNALSLDKKTPLHLAAEAGRKEVCQLLLSLHSDANAADSLGQTPLHLAAENDHSDVVKLFMRYKPELVTAASKNGMTCAHIAANKGSVAVIKELMQFNRGLVTTAKNKVNDSLPLHLAVSGGHKDVVRVLIDAGSSATAENLEGMTAIHLAAKEGNVEVLQAIPKKVSLRTLSQKNGLSPIHVAAFYGKAEIVRELQGRVDINIKTDLPQLAAAVSDPQLRNLITIDYGLTPLHLASFMGHENVVRLILNNSSIKTETVTTLLARVPLHYAAMNGHLVIVSLLMSRSASHLRSQDKKGRMPLHLAAENGHVDMVSMLLGQGAEINSPDQDGWTPLHYATRHGFLSVAKLLIESGASTNLKTVDGKIPLVLSASGGHIDVLNYLLEKEHDSNELMDDNTFLLDLMLCGKRNANEPIDEFVMHSGSPLYASARLANAYREMAFKEKERAKDLNDAGRHCEHMATELLGIASAIAPPSAILRSTDAKGNQFLDMLLENNMKQVVEHAAVQRYLSDIWAGSLSSWSAGRLMLLFLGFLLFPPLCIYFCLPFKHHHYHHVPVIKFLAMIVSHLYLIVFLTIIAAMPIDPIVYRGEYYPTWYEVVCLALVSGMIVSELTKSGGSTGLGMLRYVIIFFSILGSLFQIAAIICLHGVQGRPEALILMYMRNFMLSIALFSAIILIVDFFLIHHLFGPFGIIIRSVMRDLMTFIVVLLLFLIAFTFLICCLFSPLQLEGSEFLTPNVTSDHGGDTDSHQAIDNNLHPPSTQISDDHHLPLDGGHYVKSAPRLFASGRNSTFSGLSMLFKQRDGFNGTKVPFWNLSSTTLKPPNITDNKNGYNLTRPRRSEATSDVDSHQQLATSGKKKPKCRIVRKTNSQHVPTHPSNSGHDVASPGHHRRRKRSAGGGGGGHGNSNAPPEYDSAGRLVLRVNHFDIVSNRYWSTLMLIFSTLYFAMFAMGKPEILPIVENGPGWSFYVFLFYFGVWMITAVIILIPLLIAMLTETYKRIHQRSDSEWKFGRAKLIRDMIKMPAAPTPLNLFVRPYLYLVSLKKHGRMMCTPYASYYAAEDEHEGADESLDGRPAKLTPGDLQHKQSIAAPLHYRAMRHRDLDRLESVLDWSIAVRRYRAGIKGTIEEHMPTSFEETAVQHEADLPSESEIGGPQDEENKQ